MVRSTVEIDDDTFRHMRKRVEPGTTVVWRNVGSTSHVVDSVQFHETADQWQFRTQTLRLGDSSVYTFDEDGIYEYYCGLQGEDTCGVVLVGDVSLTRSLPCE